MGKFSREELLGAFQDYRQVRDRASRTGDWDSWANMFTEDAHYVEHAYGEMHGRETIRAWIVGVMKPFPTMTFPEGWSVIDEERGAVVWESWNAFPEPFQPDGSPYRFPNWTRIVYAGEGLWKSEEDIYNPQKDAPEVMKAWIAAGGKFEAPEQVKIQHG